MGAVSCADNSRRGEASGRAAFCARVVVGWQKDPRSRRAGGRGGVRPAVQGVEFHVNSLELSPLVETLLATRLHLSGSRFVRNLITRPRAFSYYHSTEFRVTVSNSLPGANINGLYAAFRYSYSETTPTFLQR